MFLLLALLLALLIVGPALAFPDVGPYHPYADAIQEMAAGGIVNGYLNGDFGPDDSVLRQQFAKMISLTLDLPAQEYECHFLDVDRNLSPTDPLFPDHYIAVCAAWGITTGVTATTFEPYEDMGRAQLITMVARAAGLPGTAPACRPPFGNFDATHYPWAALAYQADLLEGLAGIGPGYDFWRPATRGEVCQLLSNLLVWRASDLCAVWQAIEESELTADDLYLIDSLILGDSAGAIIGGPTSDTASVYLERSGGDWELMGIGTDLSQEDWLALGAPESIAAFLSPWSELDDIREAIALSGFAALDFQIVDTLIMDAWAGVVIGSPGLENLPILLYESALLGWMILDFGTGLTQSDWLSHVVGGDYCPWEIAAFLSPGGG